MIQETEDVVALVARSREVTENFTYDINMVRGIMRQMADSLEVVAAQRDHWKAECKALCDVVSEHTKARAARHQEGIDG